LLRAPGRILGSKKRTKGRQPHPIYPVTAAPLTKVNLKNKVPSSTGRELRLQELPKLAGDLVGFETKPLQALRKLRKYHSS
jgi:hypothetical protein